jgi:hypothetical protein
MLRGSGQRIVQCYFCRHRFEVAGRAESTSCPGCHKALFVGDIVVSKLKPVKEVRTCGRIVVKKSGRIIADLVEAHRGLECEGNIDAKKVIAGPVVIGAKAVWKGDCHALSVVIKQGAKITRGQFFVPEDDLQVADLV